MVTKTLVGLLFSGSTPDNDSWVASENHRAFAEFRLPVFIPCHSLMAPAVEAGSEALISASKSLFTSSTSTSIGVTWELLIPYHRLRQAVLMRYGDSRRSSHCDSTRHLRRTVSNVSTMLSNTFLSPQGCLTEQIPLPNSKARSSVL